jgi:hypothetical protein
MIIDSAVTGKVMAIVTMLILMVPYLGHKE